MHNGNFSRDIETGDALEDRYVLLREPFTQSGSSQQPSFAVENANRHINPREINKTEKPASLVAEVELGITGDPNYNRNKQQRKCGRLYKRATSSQLVSIETHSKIQPGNHSNKRVQGVLFPKLRDFFQEVLNLKVIFSNIILSSIITSCVLYLYLDDWNEKLNDASQSVAVLGSFLSFALVFRTQTCYNRWWEARILWGRMISACINISGQAVAWFEDEDLTDRMLAYNIVFLYAVKAFLRGNSIQNDVEEGPRLLESDMLSNKEMEVITSHGATPFLTLDIMREITYEAFRRLQHKEHSEDRRGKVPISVLGNGSLLTLEQNIWELNLCFGACNRINTTKMPALYSPFMQSFVLFYFSIVSLVWAPSLEWFTPIITGIMVFLINTVIVMGDQMICPFQLQWSGLPLQRLCVVNETEIMSVRRRHTGILDLLN